MSREVSRAVQRALPLALVIFVCTLAAAARANTAEQSWRFRVYLDNTEIGTHTFTLSSNGAERTLRSEAHFKAKILFINAYRYDHVAEERWRGGCLTSLQAQTNDNGKALKVSAAARADKLEITGNGPRLSLPGCVMSFAYWNPALLEQRNLLNAQTGEYDAATIEKLGDAQLRMRAGDVPARRYRIKTAKLEIELWYSPSGDWLALESTTASGKRLRYVLQ